MYLGNLKKNYFKRASQEKKEKNAKRHFLKDFFSYIYSGFHSLLLLELKLKTKSVKESIMKVESLRKIKIT